MSTSKLPNLKISSKVLLVYEHKTAAVQQHFAGDTTTGTITGTYTALTICGIKAKK